MKGLVWFREDIRIHDNTALYQAAKSCTDGIVGIFVIDAGLWRQHRMAACRVRFMLSGLEELSASLQKRNIPLVIVQVNKTTDIAKIFQEYMKKYNLGTLFFNRQYELNELRRDKQICDYLQKKYIQCNSYHDQTILAPGTVLTKKSNYFTVFTPYRKAWCYQLMNQENKIKINPLPKKNKNLIVQSTEVPSHIIGFSTKIIWPSGEKEARRRLKQFIKNSLFNYQKYRDFPACFATSQLSPYLSAGMISARECFLSAIFANNGELMTGSKGAITWMTELIWREFYKHLLCAFPRLSMHKPFQLKTEKLPWRFNSKQMLAWKNGKTGYPIIDAAMRQLNQTGWMHNRLRMIVAMFFTKNLFFDWRLGEDYFISHLIDGDLAANNGGWQWSASTGTDAAPYFRVFNPIRQSERFDPKGDFIKKYCPELKAFDTHAIHDPYGRAPDLAKRCKYPKRIIDLNVSRRAAIKAFKML
ncbi:deoxyribodipyrimidine photolyase [Candidatus Rickettsiella viridis]|uniref:Deoxyribodipyrimidine photo-lyase n=1 Tax=Candidatus Rickettsiella viridis TaxID=676208 RepID=A0A2Z5UW97_9COXI|nr:deoxyribodipyrimidine photo-lyase [Candidatus Rickettsiella viridis]BBB15778.1 deoxyribodipyrimidine photolyase [Candidatus Rickettsiella viridis]